MNVASLVFFVRETIISLRRSTVMNIIAIATVTITLIILGLFLLISLNFKKVTDDIVSRLEIRLFLKSNLNIEDIQIFRRKLRSLEGIKRWLCLKKYRKCRGYHIFNRIRVFISNGSIQSIKPAKH